MTELFDVKDLLTVATADQAEINTKGYFGDNLSTLIEKVRQGKVEILADVIPDVTYCFQGNNALHHAFFLPANKVKSKEPGRIMRKGLIDMLINHLLCVRVGYACSDRPKEVEYVRNIDALIDELQKMKEKK